MIKPATPLPWRQHKVNEKIFEIVESPGLCAIHDPMKDSFNIVGSIWREKDASYIETACNEFPALVDEVKSKLNNLQSTIDNDWLNELHEDQTMNIKKEINRLIDNFTRCGVKL